MGVWLKQSTSFTKRYGPFVDADGLEQTGLSIGPDIEISKNGAAFVSRNSATAPSHDSKGYYSINLDSTDTGTLGPLEVRIIDETSPRAYLPVFQSMMVVPANTYDSIVANTDRLLCDVNQVFGSSAAATNISAMFAAMAIGAVNDLSASADGFDVTLSQGDGFFDESAIYMVSGSLVGQMRRIKAYTSTHIDLSGDPFTAAPANGDVFLVFGRLFKSLDEVLADHQDANTLGEFFRRLQARQLGKSTHNKTSGIVQDFDTDGETLVNEFLTTGGATQTRTPQ